MVSGDLESMLQQQELFRQAHTGLLSSFVSYYKQLQFRVLDGGIRISNIFKYITPTLTKRCYDPQNLGLTSRAFATVEEARAYLSRQYAMNGYLREMHRQWNTSNHRDTLSYLCLQPDKLDQLKDTELRHLMLLCQEQAAQITQQSQTVLAQYTLKQRQQRALQDQVDAFSVNFNNFNTDLFGEQYRRFCNNHGINPQLPLARAAAAAETSTSSSSLDDLEWLVQKLESCVEEQQQQRPCVSNSAGDIEVWPHIAQRITSSEEYARLAVASLRDYQNNVQWWLERENIAQGVTPGSKVRLWRDTTLQLFLLCNVYPDNHLLMETAQHLIETKDASAVFTRAVTADIARQHRKLLASSAQFLLAEETTQPL